MITVKVIVLPGQGLVSVELPEGSTVADLIRARPELSGRSFSVNGGAVLSESQLSTTRLGNMFEVGALGQSKGA